MTSFVAWRIGGFDGAVGAPSWISGPNGQSLNTGFGQAEDAQLQRCQFGIQARFASDAPLDVPDSGTSEALAQLGNDRQLLPPFVDDSRLTKWRAWLQTGMSPNPAGATLPWFGSTEYATGTRVGASGVVWNCTVGGLSGLSSPFPGVPRVGQVVTDGAATWAAVAVLGANLSISSVSCNAAPPDPAAPGYYYGGTDVGLLAALVNSGFWATAADGTIVGPRLYRNVDWNQTVVTSSDGWGWCGAAAVPVSIVGDCYADGVAGADDSGEVVFYSTTAPVWTAGRTVVVGDFVNSSNGDTYYASTPGTTGAVEPFSGSTPTPSTWPPREGQTILDGVTVTWTFSAFSPIPRFVPVGNSWGLTFTGSFTASTPATVEWVPSPPDGRTDKWARLWLVLPAHQLIGSPLKWGGSAGAPVVGDFNGFWGGPPPGQTFPAQWGATGITRREPVYGLIQSILQRWTPAHVQVIGAWLVDGTNTEIDSIPPSNWNELLDVTVDGIQPPFARFNQDNP